MLRPGILYMFLARATTEVTKMGAYECAKATESEDPGYAILTVVRSMVIGIVVNLCIDCVEDSTGNESNDELREDNGQIVNAEDRSTCDRLGLLITGINVVLIVRPPTNKRGTFAVETRASCWCGQCTTMGRPPGPFTWNLLCGVRILIFLFLQELHDNRERNPACDSPAYTDQTDGDNCLYKPQLNDLIMMSL